MKTDTVIVKKTETLQIKIEPSLKAALIEHSRNIGISARVRLLIRNFVAGKQRKAS